MLFNKRALFAAASMLAGVLAQEATAPEDSAVVKLTGETFKSTLEGSDIVLAEFFAPWCGHCKKLAPEYVKAAQVLKDEHNITLAQIDCTEDQELCMEQGIQGYPTLKVFKNGQSDPDAGKSYDGQRSAEAIVEYMIKQSLPAVQTIEDAAELDALLTNTTSPVIVNYGIAKIDKSMLTVADSLNEMYTFVSVPSSKDNKLALYLPSGKDEPVVYNGKIDDIVEDKLVLEEWLKVEALPYFGEIDGSIFQFYVQSELPMAYWFYVTDDQLEDYKEYFTDLGKKYRGKMNFVSIDAKQFGRHAVNLNLKEQFPLFAIHNLTANLKYALPQLEDEEYAKLTEAPVIEKSEITQLITDFMDHKAEPIIQSEEIPEVQETNVWKLVGKTHDDIVFDAKKDVLVKYYAPWCGHCKRLAPIYEELADILAADKDAADKITIAEIDDTVNDVMGVEIPGYPTIVYYPAGKDAEPVLFESARTVEAFLDFIKANSGNKIDGPAIYDAYKKDLKAKQKAKRDAERDADDDDDEDDFDHDEL